MDERNDDTDDAYDTYDAYDADDTDDKYEDSYDTDCKYKYTYTYTHLDYEELISLTKQEETKYTLKNIVFVLIKLITIQKTKEVSFKFDFSLGPYKSWIDIADYFNSNYVGTDYRILIDEDAIVCRLLNNELIA
jgi:hypothetical protein